MRIGQDVSIQVCRDEGYMVMDYPVWDFKKRPYTTDCRFTKSLPNYCRDNVPGEKMIYLDMYLNWDDLWEIYQENQAGIDSMIGDSYDYHDGVNPHIVLNLASDIDSYCGLV